jgi:hypothetical protein
MSITKLKWQWQGTNASHDLAHVFSTPNPHTGRVITGMLTGGRADQAPQPNHSSNRTTGGSRGNTGNNGFGY